MSLLRLSLRAAGVATLLVALAALPLVLQAYCIDVIPACPDGDCSAYPHDTTQCWPSLAQARAGYAFVALGAASAVALLRLAGASASAYAALEECRLAPPCGRREPDARLGAGGALAAVALCVALLAWWSARRVKA